MGQLEKLALRTRSLAGCRFCVGYNSSSNCSPQIFVWILTLDGWYDRTLADVSTPMYSLLNYIQLGSYYGQVTSTLARICMSPLYLPQEEAVVSLDHTKSSRRHIPCPLNSWGRVS